MTKRILLGDEGVALGALHAGISAAYGYPGTPSTEILEYLIRHREREGGLAASWCANEKTAYEAALGASFAGHRALVTMKHVGLNVAADPFVNSALVAPHAGLVLAVADDPGMHSSQNEQDSRWLAEFAGVPCFEPGSVQEAYDMTREAFDLSEHFHVPVVLRLVTRLAHCRSVIEIDDPIPPLAVRRAPRRASWILLPANARRQWQELVERQPAMREWSEGSTRNHLHLPGRRGGRGVITTGIARGYLDESRDELGELAHLHIGCYPIPVELVTRLFDWVDEVLVLEDGQPYVERQARGIMGERKPIRGRETGEAPRTGELDPDRVRAALGLTARTGLTAPPLPPRPPQLCQGCAHGFAYRALQQALADLPNAAVTSDIGCYTLGALPPYSAIESCVCMGASIGMARGAADAGVWPAIAVIGDSTFLHSGLTPLLDAAAANTDMTVLILDNSAVAMTGGQEPVAGPHRIHELVLALGVAPAHCHVIDPHPRKTDANAARLRAEIDHHGLSVVIADRECIQTQKRHARRAPQPAAHHRPAPEPEVTR